MDDNLIKQLYQMISKVPKKDLGANIEQAKKILKLTKKEDLQKLINSEQISNILGKDKEKIAEAINNSPDLTNDINTEDVKKTLDNIIE